MLSWGSGRWREKREWKVEREEGRGGEKDGETMRGKERESKGGWRSEGVRFDRMDVLRKEMCLCACV